MDDPLVDSKTKDYNIEVDKIYLDQGNRYFFVNNDKIKVIESNKEENI